MSKKVRRQDWEKEIEEDMEDRALAPKKESLRPAKAKLPSGPAPIRHRVLEGAVIGTKTKIGTVVSVDGDTLMVLDSEGLLHLVKYWDTYPAS